MENYHETHRDQLLSHTANSTTVNSTTGVVGGNRNNTDRANAGDTSGHNNPKGGDAHIASHDQDMALKLQVSIHLYIQ